MSRRFITAIGCIISCLTACSANESDESDESDWGEVELHLATAPSDVLCLVLQATSAARSVTRNIDVAPGEIVSAPVAGLPTGSVTIGASAYPTACSAVTAASVASWVSDPLTQVITITKGTRAPLNIVLRPNGIVQPTIDWQDDGPAGTGGTGGTSSGGAGGIPADTTPPTVVSVVPANGTKGVTSSSNITLTFSEPMNQASVNSALSLTNVSPSAMALSWSSDSTTLTITPSGGLGYATGSTQAATTALTYGLALVSTAMDAAGNSLSASWSSSFSTLRRITQTLQPESAAHHDTYGGSYFGNSVSICAAPTETYNVGWWSGSYSSGTYYGYVVINMSALGAPSNITQIEAANITATQAAPNGDFYGSGGAVLLDELAYQTWSNSILSAPVVRSLGTLVSSASVLNPSLDILSGFTASFNTGNARALYRIAPNGNTAASGTDAVFYCGGSLLTVTYLVP